MEINISPEQQKAAEEYLKKMSANHVKVMNFVMPFDISKRFRSLMLIENDLKFMIDACHQLISLAKDRHSNETIIACVWQAIAATYGKIWTKSNSGFSKVEKSWFKGNTSLLGLHDELMNWRNKFIAHREISEHEHSMAFIKFTKVGNLPDEKTYQIKAVAKLMPTITEVESYLSVLEYLLNEIEPKISKEAEYVITRFTAEKREYHLHHLVDENHMPLKV